METLTLQSNYVHVEHIRMMVLLWS